MSTHSDFKRLFHHRESRELLGESYRNLWILIGILTLTFFAIGFASGSLSYLDQKMNNPFIRWVTLPIPATDAAQTERFKTELNAPNLKQEYLYDTISSFSNYFLPSNTKTDSEKTSCAGEPSK
ncbi:MAG: hypothetical protein IPL33_17160 [Sphingobacteriales bacterium]|nr:hypothetical protein [Sphingobacteriales bacterium]